MYAIISMGHSIRSGTVKIKMPARYIILLFKKSVITILFTGLYCTTTALLIYLLVFSLSNADIQIFCWTNVSSLMIIRAVHSITLIATSEVYLSLGI